MVNEEYKESLIISIATINKQIEHIGKLVYRYEITRTDRLRVLFTRQNELFDRLNRTE